MATALTFSCPPSQPAKRARKPRKPAASAPQQQATLDAVALEPVVTPAETARKQQQAIAVYRERLGFTPSTYQASIFDFILFGEGDGLVNAVAGSGKTTTLVQAAKLLTQPALFVAFNKHIADTLAAKLAGTPMIAKTIHSIGMACVLKQLGGTVKPVDDRKYRKLAKQTVWSFMRQPGQAQEEAVNTLTKLANFARLTLTDPTDRDALYAMIEHFGIECNDPAILRELLAALPGVLKDGQRLAEREHVIDFTDMIYLPHVWNLQPPQMPWVFVDEAQDLNAAQRELVLRCRAEGGRMIFVGDPRQAIYGFAGADSDSFWTIQQRTGGKLLPLSICYRCPASHLDLAREIVPEIEARPNAPVGILEDVSENELADKLQAGDMILCRLTAPLVKQCIDLIMRRIPARVRGRDIGKQLTDVVRNVQLLTGYDWEQFGTFLDFYLSEQIGKLSQREGTESQIESLTDRVEAVRVCWQSFGAETANDLCAQIEGLFDDGRPYVLLSTVHRAKGLENGRVFILKPERMPLVFPRQRDWEATQEQNLRYVAFTRAQAELYFIR